MNKKYVDKSKVEIKNKKISYTYEIISKIECGINLKGTEVKSIRDGMCNLKDSFALIKNGEMIEIPTGSSERNFSNNIYDFAGNMWEWTTENGKHGGPSSTYGVLRGGGFYTESNTTAVSQRDGLNRDIFSAVNVGFRVVLYLK